MPTQAAAYGDLSERAARNMLRDNLKDPENFVRLLPALPNYPDQGSQKDNFHTYAASVVQSVAFAKPVKTHFKEPELVRALAWNRALVDALTRKSFILH